MNSKENDDTLHNAIEDETVLKENQSKLFFKRRKVSSY